MNKIKIFSTPTCPYCQQVKDFLKQKNLVYEEIDVTKDENAAKNLLDISGQMGVPVTQFQKSDGKEQVVIGFDQEALENAIQ